MGVTGLWRLIDASGKPVPLETLEGKVLGIDISIWIYQVLQGYQDRRGNAVPNAHLLGLYNRICKLLYFKIKPVFVFDGGVPLLKKNTIATRKKHKAIAVGKAEKMKNDLLHNLMKHSLVKGVLAKKAGDETQASTSVSQEKTVQVNDMFKLPLMPNNLTDENDSYESDSSVELCPRKQSKWKGNIHSVDVTSDDFKVLPADVRYEILTDLKETRKQNSWGRVHEMPQESHQFSNFQMNRLLKRRKVQEFLEAAEQEMGGKNLTLEELEKLMTEQGVDTKRADTAFRIAADSTTRLIYINDPKALKSSREVSDSGCEDLSQPGCSSETKTTESLSAIPEESSSVLENINEYDLQDEWDSDIEFIEKPVESPDIKRFFGKTAMNPIMNYMIEHSGLPQEQILALIQQSNDEARNANTSEKKLKRKMLMFGGDKKKKARKDSESSLESLAELLEVKQEISTPERTVPEEKSLTSPPGKATASSSDSDSDDFVEVQDVPVPCAVTEKKMEIMVKPNEKLNEAEDIFADVFDTEPVIHDTSSEFSTSRDNSAELLDVDKSGQTQELNSSIEDKSESISQPVELNSSTEEISAKPKDIPVVKLTENNEIESKTQSEPPKDDVAVKKPDKLVPELPAETPESISEPMIEVEAPIVQNKVSERVESIVSRLETDKEELLAKAKKKKELLNMKSQLESEKKELKEHIGKLERQATEVTDQMREEAQDLLRLFGIPYVVAPQEAEAQCAYLEMINLTDGTITDDSDIWLFGGRCVYKNFFNNAKRVMQYLANDIEHHFKLSRQQMIQLALLVGSDYTVGVPGIGPVTALEILANFPAEGDDLVRGLTKFSSWLKAGRIVGPGKAGLRTKLKNVSVDKGFPNQAVVQAYLFPTVDESKTPFSWGKPNLVLLADYTREKFGWTKVKFEETMGPVMKKLEDKKSQKNLMSYFKVQTVPRSVEQSLSKRVQKAVQMMGKEEDDDSDPTEETDQAEGQKGAKKRRKAPAKKKKVTSEQDEVTEELASGTHVEEASANLSQNGSNKKEFIPQREKDKEEALKKKRQAIEVFKKSKRSSGKSGRKVGRSARKIVKEAELSESSSDSN